MFISNNLFLINSLHRLDTQLNSTVTQLSSGLRINSASDDPAGLAVATRMNAKMGGLNAALSNVNNGKSMLETADGAEQSVSNILQQMNDLAVQADNGTMTTSDKQNLQNQFNSLVSEIDHIATTTQFNGTPLLYPSGGAATSTVQLHLSDAANDTTTFTLYNSGLTALAVNNLDIVNNASTAISAIANALNSVSAIRASFGAMESRLDFTISNIGAQTQNLATSLSRIQDADSAKLTSEMTKIQVLQQQNVSLLGTFNQNQQLLLKLFT